MGKVDCAIEDGIATITFTNPPKGFFTADMVAQLGSLMTTLENDPAVRVIIFTGGLPDVFIRHFSVEEIIDMAAALKMASARVYADLLTGVWSRTHWTAMPYACAAGRQCWGT